MCKSIAQKEVNSTDHSIGHRSRIFKWHFSCSSLVHPACTQSFNFISLGLSENPLECDTLSSNIRHLCNSIAECQEKSHKFGPKEFTRSGQHPESIRVAQFVPPRLRDQPNWPVIPTRFALVAQQRCSVAPSSVAITV